MSTTTVLDPIKIIGISKRTSNAPGEGDQDFPALWNHFMGQDIRSSIPNKINDNIYAIYTDYEGDHTQQFTFVLGCPVSSLEEIPSGMHGLEISGGRYNKRTISGDMTGGVPVTKAWMDIWSENLNRAFGADFELYDERAKDPTDAVVDIFVSLKTNG